MKSPLAHLPLIVRRDHPQLRGHINYLLTQGAVTPVLPGVLRWSHVRPDFPLLARATAAWKPQGILLGATAAALTWWPELIPIQVETTARCREPPRWLVSHRTKIPSILVQRLGNAYVACPELSVLGMVGAGDVGAISEAFRRRVTTWARIHAALEMIPGSWGNLVRRRVVGSAKQEPWSALELAAYQALIAAGITGWAANHRVVLGGQAYYLDLAFLEAHLAVELDGWQYHRDHAVFIADRERQNQLALAGWTVLRFTTETLHALVPTVRRALVG